MTDFFTHIYGLLLEGDATVLIILYLGILCFWWYLLILAPTIIRGVSVITGLLRKLIIRYQNKKNF
ncbi:hypothetical protein DRE43_25230 [Salmonella enterica subsp. enterica serovar Java]|uniref:Uncharacterized protein n=1 Tax=Salmonella enterica TaxID=28901 RepID=A0A403N0C3_SALER|nr:hypothetical protein [Salmonella enterica subsp. diarizonae]EAU1515962.1 hypothetical protein [Salmonella enterica]EBQ9442492.1 hypothetical protein [Salmonella enterica subsp. enterica serovar Cerro]EBX2067891.1 hypothetical protein [Salmonella enterica subsp. enterica serovar Java]EAU7574701.1 hypothetical protein [Salmonella enterica]